MIIVENWQGKKIMTFDERVTEIKKHLRKLEKSSNHAPCCSGGYDEHGTCPNTCICGWPKMFEAALVELEKHRPCIGGKK